jgi:ureidoacrylate peracid hydrolase
MSEPSVSLRETALLLVDLQNDFLHPDGAYGRGGQKSAEIAALPARLAPLTQAVRAGGGMIVATLFTLPPGRGGEPIISQHLKQLRPFLAKGDFAPGSWGQALVDELAPADATVEKIAYSAFYMTRLEFVLRKSGIERLIVGGIVTNGGIASTVRDAHVREFDVTALSDGCATFSTRLHDVSIEALRPVARIARVSQILAELNASVAIVRG